MGLPEGDKEVMVVKSDVKKMKFGLLTALLIVSVALVVLAVIGGIFFFKVQADCIKKVKPEYDEIHDSADTNFAADHGHHITRHTRKNVNGNITMTSIVDYHSRVITMYDHVSDQCFLISGIHEEVLGSFEDTVSKYRHGENYVNETESQLFYKVQDTTPVYDMAVVNDELEPQCSRYNTYWLEKIEAKVAEHGERDKRAAYLAICCCPCCGCCYRCIIVAAAA